MQQVKFVLTLGVLTLIFAGCAISHKRGANADLVISHYKENLGPARDCYQDVVKQNPELEGDVSLEWTVNDKGEVVNPKVSESTLDSPEIHSCLLSHLKTLDFPEMPNFSKATVTYTFHFTSLRSQVVE